MKRVLAIILGGGAGTRLYPLTKMRAKPAVPLAGKYRLIDIPISNCINSGINKMYVLTQFNSASLNRHLTQSYNLSSGFGQGFVEVLAAQQTPESPSWFEGTADAVRKYQWLFQEWDVDHYLILSGDQLYRMDYSTFVDHHIASGADVSIGALPVDAAQAEGFGLMHTNDHGRIQEFREKPKGEELKAMWVDTSRMGLAPEEALKRPYLASMGIYLFSGKVMREALADHTQTDFGKEVIPGLLASKRMMAYVFDGYWEDIGTVGSFWECNLTLTDPVPPFDFFDGQNPVYTHSRYLPPAKLNGARSTRVLMADGAIVDDSELSRCVIGVRSVIRGGSRLENVVMMGADAFERPHDLARNNSLGRPDIGVGPNCLIRNAIIDKNARIGEGCRLSPTGLPEKWETDALFVRDGVIVVKKGAIVPPGTVVGG